MNTFKLSLITPKGKQVDEEVEFLVVPGVEGQAGILAHHAPIVMAIKTGILRFQKNNQKHIFIVGAGVLEVNSQNEALVLADFAQKAVNEDEAKSKIDALSHSHGSGTVK